MQAPQKVCLVIEGTYPVEEGGVGVWTRDLLHGLSEVDFRLVRIGNKLPPRERWAYSAPKNLTAVSEVRPWESCQSSLRTWARRSAPDQVHAPIVQAVGTGLAAELAMALAKRNGAKLIITEHASYWREIYLGAVELECGLKLDHPQWKQYSRRRLMRTFLKVARRAYARAARITALYNGWREIQVSQGAPAERTIVIPNGVDLPPEDHESVAPHGTRKVRVGFVGRLDRLKRPELYLQAANLLRARCSDIDPVMIGIGEVSPQLQKEMGRVRFLGAMDRRSWPDRIDVLVMTSWSEAQPLVLLEAMARGIPVVAPDVGGCAELVCGDADSGAQPAGILVPKTRSPSLYAHAIERLVMDKDAWLRASFQGRRRVRRQYTIDGMLKKYRDLYAGVAREAKLSNERGQRDEEKDR